jgi:outer membrane protein TolC
MVMRLLPIRIAADEVSTPGDGVRSEGAEAAQITFDAALGSYRNGVGSITDLNIASTQLLQAKNASIDAEAYPAALAAAASLALATGLLGASSP